MQGGDRVYKIVPPSHFVQDSSYWKSASSSYMKFSAQTSRHIGSKTYLILAYDETGTFDELLTITAT